MKPTVSSIVLCAVMALVPAASVLAEEAPETCQDLHQQITFCSPVGDWTRLSADLPEQQIAFRNAGQSIGKMIFEPSGSIASISDSDVQAAIIASISPQIKAFGGKLDILALQGGLDVQPAGTILYSYDVDGTTVTTLHSYMVRDDMVMQFITAAPDMPDTDTARQTHRAFLSGFSFHQPEVAL